MVLYIEVPAIMVDTEEEVEVEVKLDVWTARKGCHISAYNGPTPDEEGGYEIIDVLLDGEDVEGYVDINHSDIEVALNN